MRHLIPCLALLGACGSPANQIEETETNQNTLRAPHYGQPAGIETQRVYFNTQNDLFVSTSHKSYAIVDLAPGATVGVSMRSLFASDDLPADQVQLVSKLYQVTDDNQLRLIRLVDWNQGRATTLIRSYRGGSFVIETDFPFETLVEAWAMIGLRLDCHSANGECAAQAQPGEACGGIANFGCDQGLFCDYTPEAMCGWADAPGTCARRAEVCPMFISEVCGCDGMTYSNRCVASSEGVAVLHDGPCETQPQ
jgi:hypothetical protein